MTADNTTSLALLTKMQRAHQAVEDLAEEGHRIATEHDHALTNCRAELQAISDAVKTVIGDSNGSTLDAVTRLLDKLVEAQQTIAHLEQERARAEQAEDQVRTAHKATVKENEALRETLGTTQRAHSTVVNYLLDNCTNESQRFALEIAKNASAK